MATKKAGNEKAVMATVTPGPVDATGAPVEEQAAPVHGSHLDAPSAVAHPAAGCSSGVVHSEAKRGQS